MTTRSRPRKLRRFGLVLTAEFTAGRWTVRTARLEWLGRSAWEATVRSSDVPSPRDPLDWCLRATVRDVDWWDVDGGRHVRVTDLVDEEIRARFGAPVEGRVITRSLDQLRSASFGVSADPARARARASR